MLPFNTRSLTTIALLCACIVVVVACVSGGSSARGGFDHQTTGFRLEGTHRMAECESCHIDGIFVGTPMQCDGCHSQASRIQATWQPPRHLPVSNRCDSCHRSFSWVPVMRFDHLEAQGRCSSCHNNRIIAGQPPQHIVTSAECDGCHNTRAWR